MKASHDDADPQSQAQTAQAGQPPEAEAPLGPSAQQLALAHLRAHLTDWMHHEPGARAGRDAEELHQLRVAARRIEATLGLFRHQLPPRLAHARQAAKGVLRGLGAARDFDVQLADLDQYTARLAGSERAAAAPLRRRLEHERARARNRMLAMLDSEATRHWLETLNLATADCGTPDNGEAPRALTVMPERVRARYRKLRKAVRRLDGRSSMEDYHRVRRRAKRLRYAIEGGAALFGKPAADLLRALRRLQDGLGAQQDAQVAKERLAALAADEVPLPPETLFLMGRLAESHLRETRRARKTLARAWRKVSGRRWKALRARMDALAGAAAAPAPLTESTAPVATTDGPVSLRH